MFMTYVANFSIILFFVIPIMWAAVKISRSNISPMTKALWALITLAFPFFGGLVCVIVLGSQETAEKRKHA